LADAKTFLEVQPARPADKAAQTGACLSRSEIGYVSAHKNCSMPTHTGAHMVLLSACEVPHTRKLTGGPWLSPRLHPHPSCVLAVHGLGNNDPRLIFLPVCVRVCLSLSLSLSLSLCVCVCVCVRACAVGGLYEETRGNIAVNDINIFPAVQSLSTSDATPPDALCMNNVTWRYAPTSAPAVSNIIAQVQQ
jgi:hypothetical protein